MHSSFCDAQRTRALESSDDSHFDSTVLSARKGIRNVLVGTQQAGTSALVIQYSQCSSTPSSGMTCCHALSPSSIPLGLAAPWTVGALVCTLNSRLIHRIRRHLHVAFLFRRVTMHASISMLPMVPPPQSSMLLSWCPLHNPACCPWHPLHDPACVAVHAAGRPPDLGNQGKSTAEMYRTSFQGAVHVLVLDERCVSSRQTISHGSLYPVDLTLENVALCELPFEGEDLGLSVYIVG